MEKQNREIDLTNAHRKLIAGLLMKYIPDTEVWAYGSRVNFASKPYSDLDLVAFTGPGQKNQVYELREAFEESDLPFRVDLFVWDEIPAQFRKNIKEKYIVLQAKGISSCKA